jgi:hypothetical protein
MSGSSPPPPDEKAGAKPSDTQSDTAQDSPRSGRVTFDDRGNAVWEWSMSTGAYGREVDTRRLKKLEAKDLKIADEPALPLRKNVVPSKAGGGTDPYNSAGTGIAPQRPKEPAKPTDLRRLSDWIKQQKALGKKVGKE